MKNKLCLIVAMTEQRVIGKDGQLPWGKLKGDLEYFKSVTMDYPIIMGRKTHESIGRILPGRKNIVVSTNPSLVKTDEDLRVFTTPAKALQFANDLQPMGTGKVFIIGGAEIYRHFLPVADELHISHVRKEVVGGDTFFPEYNPGDWSLAYLENHPEFTVERLIRKN